MIAKLVSYSQPPKEDVFTDWNAKDLIAYAARVSNPSNQMNKETVDKLVSEYQSSKERLDKIS